MKDLGKIKFCLGLQTEHFTNEVLSQLTYTKNILKRFYMGNVDPLSTPMIVRSLDINKEQFLLHENDEELIGSEKTYLVQLVH